MFPSVQFLFSREKFAFAALFIWFLIGAAAEVEGGGGEKPKAGSAEFSYLGLQAACPSILALC